MIHFKKIKKKHRFIILGAIVLLLLIGAVILFIKPKEILSLPVSLDDQTKQTINQRIAKDLEMLKLFPKDYNNFMDLGNLEEQIGNAGQAIDYYHQAWETIPANSTPWLNIGNIYIKLGLHAKAEQAFFEAKKANPAYYFVYFNIAKLYEDYLPAKADQIRTVYLEGLKNTSNDYQLLQPFTDYLIAIKNYSEALEYLNVLFQKIPAENKQDVLNRIKEVEGLMKQPAT
ncbi:MAG: hypothetical protein NTZ18_01410 [Candidatus Komeilibacteria bacterium]|nr:hypothetical protein [Candidatus Komeilibacteria bacterium]